MNATHITRAAMLAAAIAATAPSPARAADQRGSHLLKILMLLKRAPQAQAVAQSSKKRSRATARAPAKPVKPSVPRAPRASLLAATAASSSTLPVGGESPPMMR